MKKLYIITLLLAMATAVMAQTTNIRYVKKGGAYANDGKSWANAKNNIQDAINDLVDNGLTGEVWVAEGTYTPTESTEQSGGSTLYMAFKIPAGITVKGGFKGDLTSSSDGKDDNTTRPKKSSKLMGDGGMYLKETILSGRLASTPETFTFDDQKQVFTPKFYGNTYHVVWFAMNGFDTDGRAKALTGGKAVLEGCIIEGGHANNNDLNGRKHNAYGGGIYMVDGAVVQDCEIRHCDASRDGGGVYMDGGGLLKHSYIHDCQALGVGTDSGFGGGVCLEGLKDASSTMNVIMQSVVSNNVGRFGGGLAMKVNNTANRTKLAASSVLVNNNTATTSTGGVFLYKGGAISGLTIVRNRCNGSGVYTNGIQSGRAGGLFAYDKANIANTVIWGNACAANNDIQYASERSANSNDLKPDMKFCSLSRADLCDWSGTVKTSVRSLHDANRETVDANVDHSMGYALFENPTIKAGYVPGLGAKNYGNKTADDPEAWDNAGQYDTGKKDGGGNAIMEYYAEKQDVFQPINWEVFSESALHHAGIQNIDIDKEGETDSPMETYDIRNELFNPRVTLGAYVAPAANIHPDATTIPGQVNFYVDPNYVFGHHNQTAWGNGHSWDNPTRYLANVLWLIKKNEVTDKEGHAIDLSDKTVNIYIKEGTINNTNSFEKNKRVRNVAIEVPSNVNIYGGYPSALSGTDLQVVVDDVVKDTRNPRLHHTIISGEIMGDFMTNVSHLVTLNNASNVLIDGVQIRNANATSDLLGAEGRDGAAVTIKGGSNIKFQNVLVANNAAHKGAAVYAENTTASFENCIFHNNTSSSALAENGYLADKTPTAVNGIIYSTGTSALTFDHCDVLRNVGYASVLDGTSTNSWKNSILYGNLNRATENTNAYTDNHDNALTSFGGSNIAGATGEYCLFDAASLEFESQFPIRSRFDLSYNITNENYYPRFINPTRNSGHSIGGDATFYGRSTSFEPHNLNPAVNNASHTGAHDTWGWDMTTIIQRSYGGLPDIGAIENHQDIDKSLENTYADGHRPYGEIMYVRDYTSTGTPGVKTYDKDGEGNLTERADGKGLYNVNGYEFDGSSWEMAINGNAVYTSSLTLSKRTVVAEGTQYKVLARSGRCLSVVNNQPMWTTHANAVPFSFELASGYYLKDDVYYPVYYIKYGDKYIAANPANADNRTSFVDNKTLAMPFALVGVQNTTSRGFNIIPVTNTNISLNCRGGSSIGFWTNTNQGDNGSSFYFVDNSNQSMPDCVDTEISVNVSYTYRATSTSGNIQATVECTEVPFRGENGLQHAVELQKANWTAGSPNREVWVGAGVYAKDNATPTSGGTGGDNSCFIIRDHVNVYGAFPKTGNPCKNERHPLLSQYVYNSDTSLNPADYETILEPITKTMQEGAANRVLAQPENYNSQYPSHKNYDGCEWDGFTIRNGVLDARMIWRTNSNGGAALAYYFNVTMRNFVITNNTQFYNGEFRGGAVYIGGGTAVNLYIINNKMASWDYTNHREITKVGNGYGAGAYLRDLCTMYNCVVSGNVNNTNNALGAGLFLDGNANFYNNTVVKNTSIDGANERLGGIAVWTSGPSSKLDMYNCIVYDNVGETTNIMGNKNIGVPNRTSGGTIYVYNTLVNNDDAVDKSATNKEIRYFDPQTAASANEVFRNPGTEFITSDYRLKDGSVAINTGINDVLYSTGVQEGEVPEGEERSFNEREADLDRFTDMDYTARVQDCTIDLGAYEYDTALSMTPEVNGNVASFYVTPEGFGSRNAGSPENATCAANLQKAIDAAGRYKYQNPAMTVIVKVANSYELLHPNNGTKQPGDDGYIMPSDFKYYAIRSTNQADDNVRIWSIIIPRGVEVWGGYTDVPSDNIRLHWTAADNGFKRQATQADVDAHRATTVGEVIDLRNITGNPTYFDSYYRNKVEDTSAKCYHVVTFSDRVFDPLGNPYLEGEAEKVASGELSAYNPLQDEEESAFLHMSDVIRVGNAGITNTNLHRAVLDGIFVTGGQADAQSAGESTSLNINQYGGAAIVTDYAHVRNCILKNNNANNGGALALTHKAIVSGTLMLENSANQNGGALYVFEEGDQLSDGTVIKSQNNGSAPGEYGNRMDLNMARVITSTVVGNRAPKGSGGGIWFTENKTPNVRVISSVFWNNTALDQANVFGMISPEKLTTDQYSAEEFYPFAYSAIQNIRASGTNNFSVDQINSKGVRFADTATDGQDVPVLDDDLNANNNISSLYGLIDYSTLTHTGMPVNDYNKVVANLAVAEADYMGVSRTVNTSAVPRTYVEVGARAIDKMYSTEYPMYRLFVAKPEDVDMLAAKGVMQAGAAATLPADATPEQKAAYETAKYYAQEGSSFAYPFQSLQDALDYIHLMRFRGNVTGDPEYDAETGKLTNAISGKVATTGANNIPFEIIVSRGTYHPKRDLVGNTDHALASTFTIPEGVSMYGGFYNKVARDADGNPLDDTFYGKGYSEVRVADAKAMNTPAKDAATPVDIFSNVTKMDNTGTTDYHFNATYTDENGDPQTVNYTIMERSDEYITSRRHNYDLNANSIIEPWEFQYQTILSGDAANDANNGTYHVVSVVPDENVVGVLPVASQTYKDPGTEEDQVKYGMEAHMKGQPITLDGLQIQGGYAFHYVTSAFTDDSNSDYNYYHGGGLLVDGNRYCDTYYGKSAIVNGQKDKVGTIEYKHTGRTNAVCYRDIPVNLKNCHFINNRGGFGGAVSTNTTTDIFQSSFEQNQAVGMTEKIMHKGEQKEVHYPGNGGAIHSTHELSVFNTLFANNEAKNEGTPGLDDTGYHITPEYFHTLRNERSSHPTQGLKILSGAGGAISVGKVGVFHIMNCDFVKNKANMYPAVFTMNPNYGMDESTNVREYSQFANTVFWGNEVNEEMVKRNSSYEHLKNFKFASKFICNYKRASQKSWNDGKTVFTDYNPEFTSENVPENQEALDALDSYGKPVFQEVAWFSAYEENRGKSVNHNKDMRAQEFNPFVHFDKTYKDGTTYQNCNVLISSENSVLEGPNFVNPSHEAGVAGFIESADWSPARINNLTDNGSGIIKQTIKNNDNVYTNSFNKYTAVPERSVVGGAGAGKFTDENIGDYDVNGIYATARYYADRPDYRNNIPAGDDKPYMHYVKNEAPIYRISFDPNPSHDQTYVDIGVYEYVHTQLTPNEGDEVDILWVSTDEKPENGIADGHEWSQPTSDLQRAIETLLASRNGHRKEIRLMDGTFTPIYTIEGNLSFYIDTYKLNGNAILPMNQAGTDVEQYLGVKSLTIKGGYSKDLENEYDVEKYPAIIKGQQRTNENADTWNHAFYIKDATQRYGLKGGENAYTKGNGYGSTITGIADVTGKDKVTTIPIEIDGITFINDQAKTTAEGAALYYEAQSRTIGTDDKEFNNTTTGTSDAGVNYKVVQYYQDPEHTIASPDNVPTLYATYNGVTVDNPYAISISKCKFYDSGDRTKSTGTSAVYIGTKGAISALVYNNVFQNNFGNPLVAYNAKTINNTYGLNGGYVELKNDGITFKSSILNSALWRNNANTGIYGDQAKIETVTVTDGVENITATKAYGGASHDAPSSADDKAVFNNNALTMSSTIVEPEEANGFNASLAEENTDLFNGPNFIDPLNADHSKANFNLHAGFRLLNTGLDANYVKEVVNNPDALPADAELNDDCNIYEYAWDPTTDKDAALNKRFVGRIDIGAYEYQSPLQRVFYIDPNVITAADADGSTWEKRLGKGSIQNAVNMAGLYHNANKGHEGYVFIKGASATNKGLHTEETIIPRNGVKIFGSLPAGYLNMAWEANHAFNADETTKRNEQDVLLATYEAKVINDRLGLAEPTHNGTIIEGIKTSTATAFDSGIAEGKGKTVIDGFEVMAIDTNAEGQVAEPVININPKDAGVKNLALRNLIVHDNKVNTTADLKAVAFVDKALIYEVLMRDNTVNGDGAVLKLGANGYAVNVTVEGKTLGAGDSETQYNAGTNIYNSLVNYAGHADTENTLSGYNYELEDKNLNYQLTEMSHNIDACDQTQEAYNPQSFLPEQLKPFIDYGHDRDLLGNPRLLCGVSAADMIDRGAFETWKVYAEDGEGNATLRTVTTDDGIASHAHGTWSGSHYYPHDGSVVYIMKGNNLVSHHDITPGFLLVQQGASLYGNDKKVNAAYVAVERMIKKDGSIVALPYAMKYKLSTDDAKNIGAAAPAHDGNGVLSFSPATAFAWNYNGSERSAWDYLFARKDENATSDCWHELANGDATVANNGVLYEANDVPAEGKLVRFTGKGENMGDYIYTEAGVSKTVLLTKNDDAHTDNHGADFTDPLDMGWNCFGIPYLVSEYKPYEKVTADAGANTVEKNASGEYSMSRAHTLWLYYDGVHTPDFDAEHDAADAKKVDGDGGYYSVKSWLSSTDNLVSDNPWHVTSLAGQAIWVGEGIFTQTATLDDTESLVFYRPIYTPPVSPGDGAKAVRYYGSPTGIEEVTEDVNTDNVELVGTEYYTTDGMQIREPRRGSIVIIKRIYSNGAVKATKQFVK